MSYYHLEQIISDQNGDSHDQRLSGPNGLKNPKKFVKIHVSWKFRKKTGKKSI